MKRISVIGLLAALALSISHTALATDGGRTDLDGRGMPKSSPARVTSTPCSTAPTRKCQHCHNDLYDTWKTSMHAKSWKDPIVPVKYQDFLQAAGQQDRCCRPNRDL